MLPRRSSPETATDSSRRGSGRGLIADDSQGAKCHGGRVRRTQSYPHGVVRGGLRKQEGLALEGGGHGPGSPSPQHHLFLWAPWSLYGTVMLDRYRPASDNGSHVATFVRLDDQLVFASLHGTRRTHSAVEMALDLARQESAEG